MKISHEQYVESKRAKVGELAKGMLEGSVDYLEGSIEISSLLFQIEIPEDDEDFRIFVGIASEIDHLPIGEFRKNWSKEALERHEQEVQESRAWAKKVSLAQCKSLSERFSA